MAAAVEIVFRDVTKIYPGRQRPAVDTLSLDVGAGEVLSLIHI